MLEQERLTRQGLVAGSDPDLVRKVTDRMAKALEVQGFLLAVLPEDRLLQRIARLSLLAASNTSAETIDVAFADAPAYAPLVARLDAVFASERPWSGVVTVDTLQHEGVPVLRVVPGSPAAQAGVQPGDLVSGADGQPVKKSADLIAAIAAKKPGDKLVLHLRAAAAGAQPRGVELTLAASAREVPLYSDLVYNKVMMDLRAVVEGYPGTEAAAYASLNLALCAMHFSDYAGAHEYLQKAKAELPQRPGLSRGTALYYLGLALDKLGYRPQAVEAYRAAAEAKDATLIDNDGPSVALLAARRAGP
jgi:tetratricopeptide (TPR) repeat protein